MFRLSPELLIKVFIHVEVNDLEACRLTCRRLRAIIEGSELLRYLHRMRLAGRADIMGTSSNMPLRRRLATLNGIENAWRHADFTPVPIASFPTIDSSVQTIYSCWGSLYLTTGHGWTVDEVLRLSNGRVDGSAHEWQRLRVSSEANNPAKLVIDVLVLEESSLLTAMSIIANDNSISGLLFDFYDTNTFQPHTSAQRPSMMVRFSQALQPHFFGNDFSTFNPPITGYGDILLFMLSNRVTQEGVDEPGSLQQILFCICWKEGSIYTLRSLRSSDCTAPTFIEPHIIAIPRKDMHCIELCSLVCKDPARRWTLQTLCYLRFPPLGPNVMGGRISELSLTLETDRSGPLTDSALWELSVLPNPFPPLPSQLLCVTRIGLRGTTGQFDDFRTFYAVLRKATLLKFAEGVPAKNRFDWPQPERLYVYLDDQEPVPPAAQVGSSQDEPDSCTARTLQANEWLKEGVAWLDPLDAEPHVAFRTWSVAGQHMLGRGSGMGVRPVPPLRVFSFNGYDVQCARRLILSGNLEVVQPDVGYTTFGPWYRLPNGHKVAVMDQPFMVSARPWWNKNLISNMSFTVAETQKGEAWPQLTVHGNFLIRLRLDGSQQYEAFRAGPGTDDESESSS